MCLATPYNKLPVCLIHTMLFHIGITEIRSGSRATLKYLAIIEWGWVGYEFCRILHILQKPNLIIALLFSSIIFFAQTCKLHSLLNNTTSSPGFLGQRFNDLQGAALLRHKLNMTKFFARMTNIIMASCCLRPGFTDYDMLPANPSSCCKGFCTHWWRTQWIWLIFIILIL